MSRKSKGKTCVYCGGEGISDSRDHVLDRVFVFDRHLANLPVVPSCRACNSVKSALESELTVVLPFGARRSLVRGNLATMVPRRLRINERLRRQSDETLEPRWAQSPTGSYQMGGMFHIDAEKLNSWIAIKLLIPWPYRCPLANVVSTFSSIAPPLSPTARRVSSRTALRMFSGSARYSCPTLPAPCSTPAK